MTKFWRDGYWRTSIYGDSHWVSGHWVERNDWDRLGGYDGQPAYSTDQNYYPITPISSFDSFVNPNAICPVCGEQVFFYQSPDGGKVYFDALGPPWPKHPCTDIGTTSNYIARVHKKGNENFEWKDNGWSPFIVTNITIIDDGVLQITGTSIYESESIDLYVTKSTLVPSVDNYTLFHIKKIDNQSYDISTFKVIHSAKNRVEEVRFAGYKKIIFLMKVLKNISKQKTSALSLMGLAFQKAINKNK